MTTSGVNSEPSGAKKLLKDVDRQNMDVAMWAEVGSLGLSFSSNLVVAYHFNICFVFLVFNYFVLMSGRAWYGLASPAQTSRKNFPQTRAIDESNHTHHQF